MSFNLPKPNPVSFMAGEREVRREVLCSQFAATCSAWSQGLSLRVHEERNVQHLWPEPPDLLQLGQCWRTACKKRGCEVEISHRVQNKHLAQSQTLLQLQIICTVPVFFCTLGEQPLPCSLWALCSQGLPLASSPEAIAVCLVSAEHNLTANTTIKKQCSSVRRIAQRIFKKSYNFIIKKTQVTHSLDVTICRMISNGREVEFLSIIVCH